MFSKRIELLLTIFILIQTFSFAQKVENLRFEQIGKQIYIYYDLSGTSTGQLFDIQVFCSTDGGKTIGAPLKQLSGDAGPDIIGGTGKKIVWDVLAEQEKLTGNVLFELQIKSKSKEKESDISQIQEKNISQKPDIVQINETKTIFGSFIDQRDSKQYKTIPIGSQTWMAENLNYSTSTGSWCYSNNSANCDKYGMLYSWETAITVCPSGWHLPSDAEWTTLTSSIGDDSIAGSKLKEISIKHWNSPNSGATNETSFSALPGGYRYSGGIFGGIGDIGNWWTATESSDLKAWYRSMYYSRMVVSRGNSVTTSGFNVRCIQNLPLTISTPSVTNITSTSAICGGNIISDGGTPVISRGVCWSTSQNPTTADDKTFNGTGTGTFISDLIPLKENTTYYIRAFATNNIETTYGNQISFKTLQKDQISDIEGNIYNTVTIGSQVWFKENLKTTRYNDGSVITLVTDNTAWNTLKTPCYCWYLNKEAEYKDIYGALYNWYTVNTGKLCPTGWHLPTDAEWTTLTSSIGGDSTAGSKMKEKSTTHWNGPNSDATNETVFSALPGGYRYFGSFGSVGDIGNWWTATQSSTANAWHRSLYSSRKDVSRGNSVKSSGLSVRCIQNLPLTISTNSVTYITATSAICGGNISSDGGSTVTSRGVCWSTSQNPTVTHNKTSNGTGTGTFISNLISLKENTNYYIRAYVTNISDTSYGDQVSFKTLINTLQKDQISDIDGNIYNTVTIGNQIWLKENLKTSRYNDGNVIPLVADNTAWNILKTPGYCWYLNKEAEYKDIYGALYNWYTVNTGQLCPAGWHLPTDAEWTTLTSSFGGDSIAGSKLKEKSTTHWNGPNTDATNETVFSALPGGYRYFGSFGSIGDIGNWWTATQSSTVNAWHRSLYNSRKDVSRGNSVKSSGLSVRCIKYLTLTISTNSVTYITATSAICGGNISSDGGFAVTSRGVCWSTSQNPTIADNKTSSGTGTGTFISNIISLNENTIYYMRAYATNITDTVYGDQVSFKTLINTLKKDQISDIDGNIYNTVTIGSQIWLKENLKTTKFNDGTLIPSVTDGLVWDKLKTPGYCWYLNDEAGYKNIYGALYNWYAVSTGKLCPAGWHLPTDAEWTTLTSFIGGDSTAGSRLKETGTTHWNGPNTDATNETSFTALPGGYRYFGSFGSIGDIGNWWSATQSGTVNPWHRSLYSSRKDISRGNSVESSGLSVRCLKD
jgi:uncharacterized protein (TIGR02145 family)